MSKTVSQKRWSKGLNTATGNLSEQPGTVVRSSNLLLTQRGSFQVCDGSAIIGDFISPYLTPLVVGSFYSNAQGSLPLYLAICKNPSGEVANFTSTSVTVSGSSRGPITNYRFLLVGFDSTGSYNNDPVYLSTIGNPNDTTANVSYAPTSGINTVNVYQGILTSVGTEWSFIGSGTSSPFTAPLNGGTVVTPPVSNNSYVSQLMIGTPTSSQGGGVSFSLVTSSAYSGPTIVPAPMLPGDPNFSSTTYESGYSPYGGVSGSICPIPQILQFSNGSTTNGNQAAILILGNGVAPQSIDPTVTTPTPTNLSNTYVASYPAWQASVSWVAGDNLYATSGGTNYLFEATQGGVSGSSAPSWSFTTNSLTADGSVIWKCTGPIVANVAPRGAAHAIVYAGSLWLANTSPTTTSDNIDGPTCIKMSESNNPNQWNPVNTAFIGKGDGTQLTGMASFTIAALGISPTGSLAVFKEYQTYQIIGVFGSSSFEIQPAQTDMGCLAARSIQFIPGFGICRFTHLGFSVYDGVSDHVISEEIRPYLFGGIEQDSDIVPVDMTYVYLAKSSQSSLPPMYMCAVPLSGNSGALTRIFCYDLIIKAWMIIDLPSQISSMNRIETGEGNPLTLIGTPDGTLQRIQAGDTKWAEVTAIQWSFQTQDVFGEGGSQKIFYREMVLRGHGTASQAQNMVITPTLDGVTQYPLVGDVVSQGNGSNLFEVRVKLWLNGQMCHLNIAGSGQCVIDSVDWIIDPKSNTARRIIG